MCTVIACLARERLDILALIVCVIFQCCKAGGDNIVDQMTSEHNQSHQRVLLNAFLIFATQLLTMGGEATFKAKISSLSPAKQAITVHIGQK